MLAGVWCGTVQHESTTLTKMLVEVDGLVRMRVCKCWYT